MKETIDILVINCCDSLINPLRNVLKDGSFEPNYWRANTKHEILETLHSDVFWDLILFAEPQSKSWVDSLHLVKRYNENIPTIFLAKSPLSEVAVPSMEHGADDCIPENNLEQLLPVFKREKERQAIRTKYHNAQSKTDILGSIINNSSNEVFLFDPETFDCLYANHPVLHNNGYTPQEITQLTPADVYADYDLNTFQELITPLLDNTLERLSICTKIQHGKKEAYPAEIQLTLMDRNNHRFLLAINKDISYQQDKTQKLQRQHKLTVQYRLQNKRKADLLANAAHDMRTSLTSIILSNRLLTRDESNHSPKEVNKLTNAIHHSGNHLLRYINEFLDAPSEQLSRQKIETLPVDLLCFSNELYHMFSPIAKEKNLSFNCDTSELTHSRLTTNGTYLKRILKNILSNAFKYTEHGKISFKVYSVDSENAGRTSSVIFQVSDTGIGIHESEKKKIFDRHTRTTNSKKGGFEGSGLGLHICQKLTEALGGTLEVESTPNKGSTFTLRFNAKQNASDSPIKNNKQNSLPPKLEKVDKTILVLDDSNVHNFATKEFLSYSFTECLTVKNKDKTYQILEDKTIDCFVLDYIVNGSSSMEIANYIRERKEYANTPIIIYTGKILTQKEQREIKKVADAIVQKTAGSYNTLVKTIHSCFTKSAKLQTRSKTKSFPKS